MMKFFTILQRGAYSAQEFLKSRNSSKLLQIHKCFESSFIPQRVLILTKISRYQIERQANPSLSEDQFKQGLLTRGTNYDAIFAGHQRNKATELRTIQALKKQNIDFRIRDRHNIDIESIDWADLIVPVGGDGTFLLAANMIADNNKPIVGINSDPEFSEGFLLLSFKYTNNINEIFERLKSGNFKYLMRSRIRITLHGENVWQMPFHMHEKCLPCEDDKFYVKYHKTTIPKGNLPKVRKLPWLALNEVFIGETLSARISILHLDTGNGTFQKVKSSGLCVTTGTGSSSWYRNINCLNPQMVEDVLSAAGCNNKFSHEEFKKICFDFNSQLQYPAEKLQLAYVVRDMIVKHIWPLPNNIQPRDFCDKLTIRSQCYDGGLVIDGGIAIHFNVGTTAVLETLEQDSLRNIVFQD
ncbi:NAD kinase 2, mitochondrial [Phymastichus coffea]|uniref:NAD kinase 2, mitochondrial n=1 Tax=Phymastichus coffea TaxID=108790 RepID=UPI00273BEB12|nr:NAD kinase 2, mitochondrial [Phymastichus coffea]XP_058795974.1 NAD kinase 2, mitochondrial [Phymastichus coffea]XP_058795975.1 NAD kinase 2, mitochondrial [Phymastichus coffea]XP_058795976.1 NAD kinase 2, mitochondrial [Phymastichus coffea]